MEVAIAVSPAVAGALALQPGPQGPPGVAAIIQQQLAPIQQQLTTLQDQATENHREVMAVHQNLKIAAKNNRYLVANRRLVLLCKEVSGHPLLLPHNNVLRNLPQPVAVGSSLPAGIAFLPPEGILTEEIFRLTPHEIRDLEWFYNQTFDGKFVLHNLLMFVKKRKFYMQLMVAGNLLPDRQRSFQDFLLGN